MKIRFESHRGKKPWCLDVGTFNGKRQREYFETEAAAKTAMRTRSAIAKQHGKRALTMAESKRLEYMIAEERLKKINWTIMEAVMLAEAQPVKMSQSFLSDAIAECVKSKRETGKRPAYTRKLNANLQSLLRSCNGKKVSEVDRQDVEAWARSGAKSLSTVRSRIVDAQTFFNFCKKNRWCVVNPASEIERIHLEDKPPGIHTVDEAKRILECALKHNRSVIGYLAPIYFGGLRPAEAQQLTKDKVHGDVIEVEAHKSKTRKRRFIPINETLRAWLSVRGVKYGLPKRSRAVDNLRWILSGKKTKAKKHKPKQKERVITGFPWHHDVLRHSFCSYGLPKYGAQKIAEWAGHSEQILFAHYRERVKPADADKFWSLRP